MPEMAQDNLVTASSNYRQIVVSLPVSSTATTWLYSAFKTTKFGKPVKSKIFSSLKSASSLPTVSTTV